MAAPPPGLNIVVIARLVRAIQLCRGIAWTTRINRVVTTKTAMAIAVGQPQPYCCSSVKIQATSASGVTSVSSTNWRVR
jgi:hypothetical protein